VTANWNWSQSPADNLLTPGTATIHLSPCPLGIDTASSANYYIYKVYIAGAGTPEAAAVTGGSCAPGASSGTITVTTAYAHASGYTVGSATSGIQEAWNDAWTSDNGSNASNATAPYVKLSADTNYNVYSSIYLRGRGGVLDGAGALIVCSTRDRCIYVGTTQNRPQVHHHKLYNLTGVSSLNVDGVQVASVSASSGLYTIATGTAHPFVAGDSVDCEYYSQNQTQHWVGQVLASGLTANQFQMQYGSSTSSAGANTFGFCGLLNAFIEDNSDHVVAQDVNVTQVSAAGGLGSFSYGIVNDNDQQFVIERAANRSFSSIRSDANFPMGAFVYQRTDAGDAGITYVHDSEFTNVNCIQAGGNGLVFTDSVCQGFPVFGVRYFGGLQPSTFQNIYQESTGGTYNPLYGNIAAQMGYLVAGGVGTKFVGMFPTSGLEPGFAMGGSNGERDYFVVPRSSTLGYGPLLFAGWAQPTSSSTNVTVVWPSIALQDGIYHQSLGTLTWDILMVTGSTTTSPYGTGVYAIATNVAAACGTNGICSFTDTQAAPVSYTVPTQQFTPVFWFWPVGMVLDNAVVHVDVAGTDPQAVAAQGTTGVSIIAQQCFPEGNARRRTPIWESCVAGPNNGGAGSSATVLQQADASGNGPYANSKGRLNFGKQIGAPNDVITLGDSNFAKTLVTSGERPSNDAGDMAIGVDQGGGMTQRAATSISSYINSLPSGTNFLERLTASGKTFNVPVTVNGGLSVSGGNVTLPVTGSGYQCLHVNAAGMVSGTGSDCGNGSGAGTVNSGTATQVAMYSGSGAAVSGDSSLTDNGTTLSYLGAGGIGAAAGNFTGNVSVSGQLQVAGPWAVSSPIPGTAMAASGAGTSSLGISNDGNFYISTNGTAPQKVATSATSSYFSNLWQEDANTLGAYNGANPQNLHVYSNYANSSSWQRTTLGYDANDNLSAVRSENSTPSQALGLGFMIGSNVRWAIAADSTFKPFANNSFDIGVWSTGSQLVPRTVYAGTSFDTLTQGHLTLELCNDSISGTAQNFLAKYNGQNPACAVQAGIADADGILGVVSSGSGTTGNAVITYRGYALCSFDPSSNVALGDYVVASSTNPGDCHDAGAMRPTGLEVIGRVESVSPGSGTYGIRVSLDAPMGSSGSLNSPSFTGTVTLPDGTTDSAGGITLHSAVALPSGSTASTPAGSDNSNNVATTAWVKGLGYGSGSMPSGSLGQPVTNYNGGTGYETSPVFEDASQESGSTVDIKLNNANARAITAGNSTIDARALGGNQTIAAEISIGQLRPPVLTSITGTSPGAGTYKVSYTLTSPTVTETSSSMESTITVDGSHAIQVVSPAYYGTATSYSVYMTPANAAGQGVVSTSGSTVTWISGTQFTTGTTWNGQRITINNMLYTIASVTDATHLVTAGFIGTQTNVAYNTGDWIENKCAAATNVAIGTNATISAICSGAAVSKSNNGFGVTLIPPKTGVWTVTITDTTPNTSCGLKFFDGSSFEGQSAGEGRSWYLSSNSSTNVEALFCTDNFPKQGGSYYQIKGMAAHATSNDQIQTATCVIRAPFDVSRFDDMGCVSAQSYPAGLVYGYGTGAGTRVSGSFEALSVGQPLVIGTKQSATTGSWDFDNISAVHPGNSYPNIAIIGGTQNIHFTGVTYLEGPGSGSCADAIQMASQASISSAIKFDMVQHGAFCSGTNAYLFSVPGSSTLAALDVGAVHTGNFTNLFKYNPNSAFNIAGVGSGSTHPGFTMDNNNARSVLTNFQVLGATSLATATSTTPVNSDNSTNVATTAFVKAQGYAALASPALTGTPTAPTQNAGDNSTKLATTAYVDAGRAVPWAVVPRCSNGNSTFPSSSNKALVYGLLLTYPLSTSKLGYYVNTADNTANTYDVAVYTGAASSSDNRLLHTGSTAGTTFAPSTGYRSLNWAEGTTTLAPGRYYLLITSSASAGQAAISVDSSFGTLFNSGTSGVTIASGGTSPATWTSSADSWVPASSNFPCVWLQ
jgi:hypothetical protein